MQEWLLLVYKVPSEPTRYRANVWRKLKAVGAVYLQHAVAALPADAANERVLRGIVRDIRTMHGTAYLVRSTPVGDDTDLIDAFNAARAAEYREVLTRCLDFHAELARERQAGKFTYAELEENEADLHKLEVWLERLRARDRFGVPLGPEATQAIAACRDDLAAFTAAVYRAVDHGSVGATEDDPRDLRSKHDGPC